MDAIPNLISWRGERRRSGGSPEGDAVSAFLDSTRPWGSVQVPLSAEVTVGLWAVALANLLIGGWSWALVTATWSCPGFLCWVATYGDRPGLLLTLAVTCVTATFGTALLTGGLTRAGGGQLAVLTTSTVVGVGAVLGIVLALVIFAAAVTLACCVLMAFIDRS